MALLTQPAGLNDDLRPEEIPLPPQTPENLAAVKLVLKDTNRAEYYLLAKGLTVEWDKDDRLYLFRVPQAFWEGSSVPRSSLGVPLILEHIESILPQIMQAIFADNPPFICSPRPKTKAATARAVSKLIAYQLKNMGAKEETRLGIKESLTYTAGIWKWGWKKYKKYRRTWERVGAPQLEQTDAGPVTKPTKDSRQVKETPEEYWVNEPCVERIHVRHVMTSPDLRGPDIRKAKYVIHRTYPTVTDLEQYRDMPGWDIPPADDLKTLFEPPKETPERSLLEGRSTTSVLNTGISSLDINMEFKAMPRWQDPSADPALQPLEMLEYWTDSRVIVVLNRKLCIKNEVNEFGKIPFLSVPYIDVLDSFYGVGVSRLLGGEQRLQQGVINSRLDDLALRLSGTFLRKRGGNTPTQQLRLRPGGIIDSDDEKGVQMIQYPPAIADAFTEVAASDQRAERRTGANSIVTQGNLPEATSVTRTASGMQTLSAGVGARMGYFVDFIVDLYFIPLLENIHEMNARWLETEEIERILDEELAEAYEGDVVDIKNARVSFDIQAGTRIRAKQAMAQQLVFFQQLLQQAPVIEAIQDQGKKIAYDEMVNMAFDVSDWPGPQNLIVKLSDEDKQRLTEKNAAMQQQSLEATKHRSRMEEIEQKGIAQSGSKVVEELVAELRELMGGVGGQPGAASNSQPSQ